MMTLGEVIAAPGNAVYDFGSADCMVIYSSGHATVVATSSGGHETFVLNGGSNEFLGGTGTNVFTLVNGSSGGFEEVGGFKVGTDTLSLVGYGPDEAENLLASAFISAGSTVLQASGLTILLNDVTGLTAASFTSHPA